MCFCVCAYSVFGDIMCMSSGSAEYIGMYKPACGKGYIITACLSVLEDYRHVYLGFAWSIFLKKLWGGVWIQ